MCRAVLCEGTACRQVAEQMDKLKNSELKELAMHTLDRLRGRVVSFEEEDFVIRELLSEVFQAEGDWSEAAKCLAAINMETGTRCRTPLQKGEKYVRIAELYLEDEDAVAADTFCTRAAMVMHEVQDVPLQLRFRVCHARILDSKRKFLDAASKYCDLSQDVLGGRSFQKQMLRLACSSGRRPEAKDGTTLACSMRASRRVLTCRGSQDARLASSSACRCFRNGCQRLRAW